MAEKTLNTRVLLKYDTYANWTTNNPTLKAGEVAFATIATGATQDHNSVAAPQVLIKVGDGVTAYNTLPFASAKAQDVYSWAKKAHLDFADLDDNFKTALATYIQTEQVQDTNTVYRFSYANDTLTIESQEKGQSTWTKVTDLSITLTTKVDKDTDAVAGNLAQFVAGGNIVDSGEKISDFMKTAAADAKYATIAQHEGLAETVSGINTRLGTAETDITNLKAKDTELAQAIAGEKSRAEGIEAGLESRLAAVESDYLKAADKTELKDLIDDNTDAIEANAEEISKNATAIATEKQRAEGVEADFESRIAAMETFWDTTDDADGVVNKLKEIQSYIASDESGAATMAGNIQTNAQDIDKLEGRMDTAEGKIEALEEKAHTHDNKTVLDGISAAKVSTWDAAVQTVTAGTGLTATKTGTDVAIGIDEATTFIFNCGDSDF